ncbi:MAG: FtsQ-type POTRA domain-containing protein [Thermodesulfobacteriota bacterium]
MHIKWAKHLLTVFFSIIIILLGLLLVIFKTDFFKVEEIKITGNKRVSENEIVKRSMILPNISFILFNKRKAEASILKNRWISKVQIEKEYPDKVSIMITESEPFCLIRDDEENLVYIDADGIFLEKANFSNGLDFPIIIGEGIYDPELLSKAIQILKYSKESTSLNWQDISEINVDPIFGITVLTSRKKLIDMGKDEIDLKWKKLEIIFDHLKQKKLDWDYIDQINLYSEKHGVVNYNLHTIN